MPRPIYGLPAHRALPRRHGWLVAHSDQDTGRSYWYGPADGMGDSFGPLVDHGRLSRAAVFASRADARQALLPYVREFGAECVVVGLEDGTVAGELAQCDARGPQRTGI